MRVKITVNRDGVVYAETEIETDDEDIGDAVHRYVDELYGRDHSFDVAATNVRIEIQQAS
jgi:hypothetical protein